MYLNLAVASPTVTVTSVVINMFTLVNPGSQELVHYTHSRKNSHAIVSHDIFIAIVNGCSFKMSTSCIVDMFTSLRRLIFQVPVNHVYASVKLHVYIQSMCGLSQYLGVSMFQCHGMSPSVISLSKNLSPGSHIIHSCVHTCLSFNAL